MHSSASSLGDQNKTYKITISGLIDRSGQLGASFLIRYHPVSPHKSIYLDLISSVLVKNESSLLLPRQIFFSEMPVVCGLAVDRPEQIQSFDYRGWAEVEAAHEPGCGFFIPGAESVDLD